MWMRSGPLMVLHLKGHITLMHVLARHVLVLSIKMNIRIWESYIYIIKIKINCYFRSYFLGQIT